MDEFLRITNTEIHEVMNGSFTWDLEKIFIFLNTRLFLYDYMKNRNHTWETYSSHSNLSKQLQILKDVYEGVKIYFYSDRCVGSYDVEIYRQVFSFLDQEIKQKRRKERVAC